eukprot:scaffold385_cov305-Pinguiococcus_pyrenoidosus.AAC.45
MVLAGLDIPLNWASPEELVPSERPPWTIDLSFFLQRALKAAGKAGDVSFVLATSQAGVADEHQQLAFYESGFPADAERVKRRFAEAESEGIPVLSPVHLTPEAFGSLAAAPDLLLIVLIDVDCTSPQLSTAGTRELANLPPPAAQTSAAGESRCDGSILVTT